MVIENYVNQANRHWQNDCKQGENKTNENRVTICRYVEWKNTFYCCLSAVNSVMISRIGITPVEP